MKTINQTTACRRAAPGLAAGGAALLAGALLLLAGCSKEPGEGPGAGEDGRVEITVSASLPGSLRAETKAPTDPAAGFRPYFVRADEASAGYYGAYQQTPFQVSKAISSSAADVNFSPAQYYLSNGLRTRLVGFFPQATFNAGNKELSWTIDGTQDVWASDLTSGSKTAPIGRFTFQHQLAQIQFWPYAENTLVSDQWGPVTGISVRNCRTDCKIAIPDADGQVQITGSGSATFTARNLGTGTLPTTAQIMGDGMMLVPMTTATALELVITTSIGGTLNVTVPARTYPANSCTAVRLRFTPNKVQVEPAALTVSDWTSAADQNFVINTPSY